MSNRRYLLSLKVAFSVIVLAAIAFVATTYSEEPFSEKPLAQGAREPISKGAAETFTQPKLVPPSPIKVGETRKTYGIEDPEKAREVVENVQKATPATEKFNVAEIMFDKSGRCELAIQPGNEAFLKAWGYQPDTIMLFEKMVGVDISWEPHTKQVRSVEVSSPATQVPLSKEIFLGIYDLVRQKNEKPTLEIFRYSFEAVGSNWDLVEYNWGEGYIGFKFYKEPPPGQEMITVKSILFPITHFPMGKQQIDNALATVWCQEIAKSTKGDTASNFEELAVQLFRYSPIKQ